MVKERLGKANLQRPKLYFACKSSPCCFLNTSFFSLLSGTFKCLWQYCLIDTSGVAAFTGAIIVARLRPQALHLNIWNVHLEMLISHVYFEGEAGSDISRMKDYVDDLIGTNYRMFRRCFIAFPLTRCVIHSILFPVVVSLIISASTCSGHCHYQTLGSRHLLYFPRWLQIYMELVIYLLLTCLWCLWEMKVHDTCVGQSTCLQNKNNGQGRNYKLHKIFS